MKLAHVRERHAPAGAPWRLAAALDAGDSWLDLEIARRRALAANAALAHNETVYRRPITTLDDHLAAGMRIEALRPLIDGHQVRPDDDAVLAGDALAFGPPILRPPSLRDFYAFERHVGTMWARRGSEIPEAWFRLPIFYFSNVSEIRGPTDPVWAPKGSEELDYELEVAALVDTPAILGLDVETARRRALVIVRGESPLCGITVDAVLGRVSAAFSTVEMAATVVGAAAASLLAERWELVSTLNAAITIMVLTAVAGAFVLPRDREHLPEAANDS